MVPLTKAHANRNDYLVLEEAHAYSRDQGRHAQLARHLCAHNTGTAADGIEFPRPTTPSVSHLEADFSDKGSRCDAKLMAFGVGTSPPGLSSAMRQPKQGPSSSMVRKPASR